MKLTVEQVRHVAELARLGLSDEEMQRLTGELSKILDYIDQLAQLDTSSLDPTAQVGGLVDVFREDEVWASLPIAAALANAPASQDGYFRVRAMQE
ncbi:MAG TPA: Asp-tRNA(Asn)/Glu-tRNA(Gln) amidotransferase subunit GatC [Candidatus Dormibacteraeota bacterium]|nr:Asp-tRNA(Asn)/Glu-tRNA(Gln) amidotransferase subunit GatC [Candidatus Dormibacteraeota bacterium]